ncbi:MAG: ATP-grasp domain-containing protein [Nanoarchaeota archaeon]|nr:ATP-grasp domain-containing protein [Nanoarchaeota archaeon]
MKFTLLITSSGSVTAQGVIKGLKQQQEFEYRVIMADMNEKNAGRYFGDQFYKVPSAKEANYIDILLDICKKEQVNVLVPIYDPELLKVAENKQRFKDIGCTAIISSPETIRTCNDKYQTYQFFKKIGIDTPETHPAEDILSGKVTITYPAFGKPARGMAAIGTITLQNEEELKKWAPTVEEPLVQELTKGTEFSVDTLADLNGQVIEVVPRTRDETRHGASTKGITTKDQEIITKAKYIAEQLHIQGPCNIQCFRTKDNILKFFEINPRFSATHAHSIASGMNSPYLLLKMLAGQQVSPQIGSFQDGLQMYRYWSEVFVDKEGKRVPQQYTL